MKETIRLAFKSLKHDTKKTRAYFLFQIFISIVICICCHFCADRGIYIQNIPEYAYEVYIIPGTSSATQSFPPPAIFSMILIFTVSMLGFYAYRFIYQEQSKKIAIFRIGGVSTGKIILFLLSYLFPIILLAIITGVVVGFILVQVLNYGIFSFSQVAYPGMQLSVEAIFSTIIILFVQAIYYIVLTLGFVHRNEIKDVLTYSNSGNDLSDARIKQEVKSFRIIISFVGVAIVMYFLTIAGNDLNSNLLFGCLAIGIATKPLIKDILISILERIKRKRYYTKTNGYFGLSFATSNLIKCYSLILILSILYQFSSCLIVFFNDNLVDLSISSALFMMATLTVMISIGFQLLTEAKQKKKEYFELFRIGKTNADIKRIINYDLSTFLFSTFLVSMIIPSVTLGRALLDGMINIELVMIVVGVYSMELIILYFVVKKGYYHIVKSDT